MAPPPLTNNVSTIPPILVPASQSWDGNDGKWSSFVLRVGTPAQYFRVFPSPATREIIIPSANGCTADESADCGALRGVFPFRAKASSGFFANASTSWKELGDYGMDVRPELNFTADGSYGTENIGLGMQSNGGVTLTNQVVAGVAEKKIYVGLLGLSSKPVYIDSQETPYKTFLQSLRDQRQIPGLGYGYTAGTSYNTPNVLGSLVLGGYDESRIKRNDFTFPFDPDDSQPVSLEIQSISGRETLIGAASLLEKPTYAQIDFAVPHLWLPLSACDNFASAFGLIYDDQTDLYRVNDSTHNKLLERNPKVTIGLGPTSEPLKRVNINLPYRAFDLEASYPIYPNATKYFPIRRAYNESQYTLGRVLLQEAYLIVDYERGDFSIHQAAFPETNQQPQILPILPHESAPGGIHNGRDLNALSKGAIVGISLSLALVVVCLAWIFHIRKSAGKVSVIGEPEVEIVPREDGGIHELNCPPKNVGEIGGTPQSELHGSTGLYLLSDDAQSGVQEMPSGS